MDEPDQGLIDLLRRVGDRQCRQGPGHGGESVPVLQQPGCRPVEAPAVALRLQQHHRSPVALQHPGILLLVVIGHVGGGHQDGRLGDGGQLRDGGGPRPTDHQVGGSHHQGHVVDILPHLHPGGAVQLDAPALQLAGEPGVVPPRPVDVVEGPAVGALGLDEVGSIAVHHLGPQAAPVGQQHRPLVGDPQGQAGLLPGVVEKVPAHRGAGDHHPFRVGIVSAGVLKAHQHPVHHTGKQLGGQAGHGVGLVNGGGDAPPGRLPHHGVGGVAPGAHHQVGLEIPDDLRRLTPGSGHGHHRDKIMLDVLPAEGPVDGVDIHGPELVALLGHQIPLHAVVGTGEEDVAAGVVELKQTGQRDGRIDVSGGAAAGKENVQASALLSGLWGRNLS